MAVNTQQTCPRCQRHFPCRPEAIATCQCRTVELNEAQRRLIRGRYQGCLCAACLQALRDEIDAGRG
ncbi:cysteine-rich CWC family protein [Sulfuriflexus mobilis]|uniref:cysteine-rich CWC family protein n=1 Tax=Sulfuriflexus mobilis TaxID=1811807 RepID=UPI000F821E4A|nr:cysteine-rich CWC family protein [Sulfuriflexus mobilis]